MILLKFTVINFIVFSNLMTAQTDSTKTKEYLKALEVLQKKDTTSAITFFKNSIKQSKDAPSYFELAKIKATNKTNSELMESLRYIRKAIEIYPLNIQYRLLIARIREDLFYASKLNFDERLAAIDEYKEILNIDSTNSIALYNLGRLKSEDFLKLHTGEAKGPVNRALSPVVKSLMFREKSSLAFDQKNEFDNTRGNFPTASYEKFAQEAFHESENFLIKALHNDTSKESICWEISNIYIYNGSPEKAISIWDAFIKKHSIGKTSHLYLGLLYYLTHHYDKSAEEFERGISLMSSEEREDFTFNSALVILESKLGDQIKIMSKTQLIEAISQFWQTKDPLILSKENERLLEHYYRVTYANLFFGNTHIDLTGWKTDRGEILIRYGQPLNKVRYMQEIDDLSLRPKPRTEVWDYGDKSFAFIDPMRNNSYQFAQPWTAIVPMNTHDEVISLRQTKPDEYFPKFEGPIFDLSYQAYQFASKNRAQTDIFLSYEINFSDTATTKEKFANGYDVGLFMFDKNFNKQSEYRKTYDSGNFSSEYVVNYVEMTLSPQSGNLAFEMMRKKDKGVAAYHGKYNVKNFSSDKLNISDVVLASNVETEQNINGAFKRNNISILPNPTKSFSKNNQLYLYYEIYNLKLNTNNLTDFEQKITIQKKEESGVINSLLSVVGLDKEGKKIALTSKYQSQEKDPQMYLQLDMSRYEPGKYVVTVSIKDNATEKEVSSQTEINWQ